MLQSALIIMIKNPIAGKTKTRLAEDVGDETALEMYGILSRYTRDQAVELDSATRYLHYSEFIDEEDDWPNDAFVKLLQIGPGLGERMKAAFEHAFARGHSRVIIIGSDCPGVTTALLQQALQLLDTSDLVVGPANDGGYYLLGLRHPAPYLFEDMTWSTSQVLDDTLARAQMHGLSVQHLPVLSDVDHLEDWLGYGWVIPEGGEIE